MITKFIQSITRHILLFLMLWFVLPLGAQVRSKADLAKQLLQSKSAETQLSVDDLASMKISSETFSAKSGVTNVYFQQYIGDIPVHGAILNAHVTKTTNC
ncbi:MAG: hypothetical protein IPM82_32380 [Saprospiraceae bacterium]|nr:hypothetical protein [Saprospiraceae bacterium]